MSGFRNRDGGGDCQEVAHLADEQHVRRLPKGRPQGVGEGRDIRADLALLDNTSLVSIDVLDRILDSDHVAGPGGEDVVDHGGQGRRLARAGRPGDEDEPLIQAGEPANNHRNAQLIEGRNLVGDQPEGEPDRSSLLEGVDPESRLALPVEGEIQVAALLKPSPAFRGQDLVSDQFDLLRAKGILCNRNEYAVLAHGGRRACREDQVGGRLVEQGLEVGVDDQGMWVGRLALRRH